MLFGTELCVTTLKKIDIIAGVLLAHRSALCPVQLPEQQAAPRVSQSLLSKITPSRAQHGQWPQSAPCSL